MKYESGDILYYVDPFMFFIEQVNIEMAIVEDDDLYYIDSIGAYLKESDLFTNLKEAQKSALERLDKFYYECRYHILNNVPKLSSEDF